jgi:antirestriction protein ArdC
MYKQQQTIRADTTSQIIAELQSGNIAPRRQPWVGNGLPANVVLNRRYPGVNVLLLQLHMLRHILATKYLATFRQWRTLGCRVKPRPTNVPPGQWACTIVFNRFVEKTGINDVGDEAIATSHPDIRFQGESAFYAKRQPHGEGDDIHCPEKVRFGKANDLYGTLLHELGHWSESRLRWAAAMGKVNYERN